MCRAGLGLLGCWGGRNESQGAAPVQEKARKEKGMQGRNCRRSMEEGTAPHHKTHPGLPGLQLKIHIFWTGNSLYILRELKPPPTNISNAKPVKTDSKLSSICKKDENCRALESKILQQKPSLEHTWQPWVPPHPQAPGQNARFPAQSPGLQICA